MLRENGSAADLFFSGLPSLAPLRHTAASLLIARGLVRGDPLQIGIEIGPDRAIVDKRGQTSRRLLSAR